MTSKRNPGDTSRSLGALVASLGAVLGVTSVEICAADTPPAGQVNAAAEQHKVPATNVNAAAQQQKINAAAQQQKLNATVTQQKINATATQMKGGNQLAPAQAPQKAAPAANAPAAPRQP